MSEYLMQAGRRAELRRTEMKLNFLAGGHRDALRLALDPHAPIAELPAEKILTLAAALAEAIADLQETEAKIKAINDLIGK